MLACLLVRQEPHYRYEVFVEGLRRSGYKATGDSSKCDLLITWNRMIGRDAEAARVLSRGGKVLVAENAYLGNGFLGEPAFTISRNEHNGLGLWPNGDGSRWDSFGVPLLPWRRAGSRYLVLPQRGIGSPAAAMPRTWTHSAAGVLKHAGLPYHIREHPGKAEKTPLENDLKHTTAVVTWGSGAASKALVYGVPVFYDLKNWVMAGASRPLSELSLGPLCDDARRLAAFRRMAWSQWRISEIASGFAFDQLLRC